MLIIHGDHTVASRKELEAIKEKNKDKEIVVLDGKSLDLTRLKETLEAKSLFGQDKLVIIENLFKFKRGNTKEFDYLLKQKKTTNLILWEDKELKKTMLPIFKNAKIRVFKIEKIIFSLVESLRPQNIKTIINLFKECLTNNSPETIFSMIIRQFRLLILIKSGAKNGPEEFKKLTSWQKQRLTNQAKFFTMERLVDFYQKLLEIDYKNKTGRLVFDLKKTLEIMLVDI